MADNTPTDRIKVEAAQLSIGMEMELVVVPFTTDPEGREVLTYAFAPVATQQNGAAA